MSRFEQPVTVNIARRRNRLLRVYYELKKAYVKPNCPFIINFGGGGSAKSYSTSQFFARQIFQEKVKLLVLRKFATSLNDSVVSQFKEDALPFWDFQEKRDWKYNKTNRTLSSANGSQVLFRGLDNPEKFKSINGITAVWIEEATELYPNDFKILNDRIRGNPKIILTYNPISERHWLRARFHGEKDPYQPANDRITTIFSTFHDNPFVGQKYMDDMAWYKDNDPDHYRIYGLGEFGLIRPENPYFTAYKPSLHLGEPAYQWGFPIYVSADFNVKNTFLISQHKEGMGVDYLDIWHGGTDLEGLCQRLATTYGHGPIYFTGDASGNNNNALTTGNRSAWQLIEGHMKSFGVFHCDYSRVPTANPSTASNRHVCNALLTYFGSRVQIHRVNCALLIDDIERMSALSDGRLNKPDCDKHDYGHAGDAFRYDMSHFEYSTFEQSRQWGTTPWNMVGHDNTQYRNAA